MRIIKDASGLYRIGAGRSTVGIPVPCIYLTERERSGMKAGIYGVKAKLDGMKAENPGAAVVSEGMDGRLEVIRPAANLTP